MHSQWHKIGFLFLLAALCELVYWLCSDCKFLFTTHVWYYNTQGMMNFLFFIYYFVNWFLLLHAAGKLLMFVVTSLYQWHKSVLFLLHLPLFELIEFLHVQLVSYISLLSIHYNPRCIPMTWSLVFSSPLTYGFIYLQLVGCFSLIMF